MVLIVTQHLNSQTCSQWFRFRTQLSFTFAQLYAKVGYDEDNKELTNGKHIQVFMEDLQARDPIIHLPTDFIMVSRSTLMLRGLAHALHQSRSVAKAWRPIAERVLREDI